MGSAVACRVNILHLSMQNQKEHGSGNVFVDKIFAWDTDASYGLLPFQANFIDYMEVDVSVKDIRKE